MYKLALTAAAILTTGVASASAIEPVYWRTRVFFIPYQAAAQPTATIDKVQLLVARDGGGEWAVLQEAQAHVRGFSYHAPDDGEYAFALRTSDRKGNLTPTVIAQPQLRVIVDTSPPALDLTATLDATGRILVHYEASDVQLKPEMFRLEAQSDGVTWQRLATGPPDVSQPDRIVGRIAWKPPTAAGNTRFRATIDDRAGNQVSATAEASLMGPLLTSPAGPMLGSATGAGPLALSQPLSPNMANLASNGPFTSSRPALEWPAASSAAPTSVTVPPLQNAYTAASTPAPIAPPLWPNERTPAKLVADTGATQPSATDDRGRPSNPFAPPPLFDSPLPLPPISSTNSAPSPLPNINPGWTAPTAQEPAAGPRWVNATTFDVDYDLQTVGPWGVSKVELWATRDCGREWVNFGADPDNRGPMRVTVPGEGLYGFRLAVSGANGTPAPSPGPGDKPELEIGVDLQEPQAELKAAEIGQGNLSDHLIIRWAAADENLEARPAGLFFSTGPEGPWATIATDLDNNGQYAWRLLQQIPEKLYLRLEVRDKAGNVAVRQSPAPVVLHLPQPTGRLRSVRPVQEEPTRYRTASGIH